MKLKDIFQNKKYTFSQWAKNKGIALTSKHIDCSNTFQNKKYTFSQWAKDKGIALTSKHIDCCNTYITSLEGAPTSVGGSFNCYNTDITSLQGAPTKVGGDFNCYNTNITSLQGAPTSIGGDFYCRNTKITSLENIHHYIHHIGGTFYLNHNCPIKSNVLGVLWIGCDKQGRPRPDGKAPKDIKLDNKQVERILNRYLEKIHSKEMTPREALLQAQNELQDAGLDEYADL